MLLTTWAAAANTENINFVFRDERSLGYFFDVTGEVTAHLYVTPVSHLYVHYGGAQKKLLRETLVKEAGGTPPSSVFAGHEYVKRAVASDALNIVFATAAI